MTCIVNQNVNCSPSINCLESDQMLWPATKTIKPVIELSVSYCKFTVLAMDSTSAYFETSAPKVRAWPPDASIYSQKEEYTERENMHKQTFIVGSPDWVWKREKYESIIDMKYMFQFGMIKPIWICWFRQFELDLVAWNYTWYRLANRLGTHIDS